MKKKTTGNKKKTEIREIDIYNIPRRLKDATRRLQEDPEVSKKNKELIVGFDQHNKRKQCSGPYRDKCLNVMRNLAQLSHTDFDKYTKKDAEKLVDAILDSTRWGQQWKWHMLKTFKTFFKWMKETDDMPQEVKWIKVSRPKNPPLNPNELLSIEDVKVIADSCDRRDRAFVKTLWESGCRIGEFLTLRLKDVEKVDKDGCFLNLQKSKTELRKIFIYYFYPDLQEWIWHHPQANNPNAPLWPNLQNGHNLDGISYRAAQKLFRKAINRCGGFKGKKIHLHSLRHSSVSHFAHSNTLTDAELKYKFWGNAGTQQLSRYCHMNPYNIADKIRGKNGRHVETPEPQGCPGCGTVNDGLSKECRGCGKTLNYGYLVDRKRAMWYLVEEFTNQLSKDPSKNDKIGEMLQRVVTTP